MSPAEIPNGEERNKQSTSTQRNRGGAEPAANTGEEEAAPAVGLPPLDATAPAPGLERLGGMAVVGTKRSFEASNSDIASGRLGDLSAGATAVMASHAVTNLSADVSGGTARGEATDAGGEETAASLSTGASYNLSGGNIGGIDEDEDEDGDDAHGHDASSLLSSTSPPSSIRNEGIAQSTTGIDGESADEVLKRRNREHARQTRLRKKAYVVGLEHSLKDLQAQISKDAAKDSTREALRNTMEAETTLLITAFFRGELSLEMLARSAAQRVQLVSPVTPFRSFPPNDAFDGMTYSVGAHSIVAHSRSWLTFFKHTIGFATNGWCLAKIQGHTPAIEVKVMRLPSVLCCVVRAPNIHSVSC